jgi:hypothetical protein
MAIQFEELNQQSGQNNWSIQESMMTQVAKWENQLNQIRETSMDIPQGMMCRITKGLGIPIRKSNARGLISNQILSSEEQLEHQNQLHSKNHAQRKLHPQVHQKQFPDLSQKFHMFQK